MISYLKETIILATTEKVEFTQRPIYLIKCSLYNHRKVNSLKRKKYFYFHIICSYEKEVINYLKLINRFILCFCILILV